MAERVSGFSDHFSERAGRYRRFRPDYPQALFSFLAASATGRRRAWDCATGSGQAATALASEFERVVATDGSPRQLAAASPHPRVTYAAALAECAPLAPASMDLVTVAQALHWFDFDAFYREVRRVARPGAVVAAWTYSLFGIDRELDPLVRRFYNHEVGEFWPPERRYIDGGYAELPFPFVPLETPRLEIFREWTLDELGGYLGTWSAVSRYEAARGVDPVPALVAELAPRWGPRERRRRVTWPLHLLVGRVV